MKHWVLRLLPWLLLWAAFAAFGVWVHSVLPWQPEYTKSTDLYALDYRRYSQMLEHWHMIFYACFRHPLYGWIMSPVIGIGAKFRTLGVGAYWGWLIAFFSGVMTLAHALVYILLRRLSLGRLASAALTALFASFAASWLLAACPESFNISCVLALLTLHFALYVHRHADTISRRREYAGWTALAILTGGITSTQVVKTALAYAVTRRPRMRTILLIGLIILGAGVLVGLVFLLRLYLRTPSGQFGHEFAAGLGNIGGYLVGGGMSLSRRLGCVFVFFTEPFLTRGAAFDVDVLPTRYASPVLAVLALLPILSAVASAWLARRDFIVRLMGAMFLVDVGIHFILFWGMEEAQIYAGHWYYAVPLLIGAGLLHLPHRPRRVTLLLFSALAATLLALNLHTWLTCGG